MVFILPTCQVLHLHHPSCAKRASVQARAPFFLEPRRVTWHGQMEDWGGFYGLKKGHLGANLETLMLNDVDMLIDMLTTLISWCQLYLLDTSLWWLSSKMLEDFCVHLTGRWKEREGRIVKACKKNVKTRMTRKYRQISLGQLNAEISSRHSNRNISCMWGFVHCKFVLKGLWARGYNTTEPMQYKTKMVLVSMHNAIAALASETVANPVRCNRSP